VAVDGHERPADEGVLERARLLDELEARQTLLERPFTSKLPVIGRLIVAVRTAWNSVATKWYVRPMAHQQSTLNAEMVGYLRILQDEVDHMARHSERIERLEALARGQLQESAENVRELTALAERLARLEGEPARLETSEPGQQARAPR
jgi:hypothetical protein